MCATPLGSTGLAPYNSDRRYHVIGTSNDNRYRRRGDAGPFLPFGAGASSTSVTPIISTNSRESQCTCNGSTIRVNPDRNRQVIPRRLELHAERGQRGPLALQIQVVQFV